MSPRDFDCVRRKLVIAKYGNKKLPLTCSGDVSLRRVQELAVHRFHVIRPNSRRYFIVGWPDGAYGVEGLLVIHWRTKVVAPQFVALAQFP